MKILFTYTALLLLLAAKPLYAEIYQITDSKGNKVYTNIAPKSGEKNQQIEAIKIRETNITPSDGINDEDFLELQTEVRKEYEANTTRFESERQAASLAVKQAETELEQAKELKSGDYFNIPGKGMRYKDHYHERVQQAEENLVHAKEQLQALLKNKPSKAPVRITPEEPN